MNFRIPQPDLGRTRTHTRASRVCAAPWLRHCYVVLCFWLVAVGVGPKLAGAVEHEINTASMSSGLRAQEDGPNHEQILEDAWNYWLYGDWNEVIRLLEPLLLPEAHPALSPVRAVDAYALLGTCYVFIGNEAGTNEAFYRLLLLEPDYQLDPLIYPVPVIHALNDVSERHSDELDRIRAEQRMFAGSEGGQLRYIERRVMIKSPYVSMLPFGIGHFSNGEVGWGIAYLTLESALAITSMALYVTNEHNRGPDGFFSDPDLVSSRQRIQLISAYSFYFVLVVNVVHGLLIHRAEQETTYRSYDQLPVPGESRLRIWPVLGGRGASGDPMFGLGGSW